MRDILTRGYVGPRPKVCSLNLPDGLLGGWANFDVKAIVDDTGWRGTDAPVRLGNGIEFIKARAGGRGDCCFISQWQMDKPQVVKPVGGRARRVHLLLAGTTFPQAMRSCHAEVTIRYATGEPFRAELRSPNTWWPVEQDYMRDDYIFRVDSRSTAPVTVDWRVDLRSGQPRALLRSGHSMGGAIRGGSAFVVSIETDPERELGGIELHTRLYGVVLAWMGLTMERA